MINAIKIFLPSVLSFITGILLTPIATHFFYKYKMWRRVSRKENIPEENRSNFDKIHDEKSELSTPRTGGVIIWMSVILTLFILLILDTIFKSEITGKIYFISRNQTILPFFAFIFASIVGLGDDFLQIFGRGKWTKDPIFLRYLKIGIIFSLGLIVAIWFYSKLGISELYIPWFGFIELGFFFIPFFILVMIALWSTSVIDGVDGLSGGVMASVFGAYTIIALFNNQIDIAALCGVVTGAVLAFLWFNIPPARFYMGETGMIGLTVLISVIAFLTDTVLLLPVIAFPLFVTSISVIIQIISIRFFKKKFFLLSPLHHHFEAMGWSRSKITMRYWIVSIMTSISGVIIYLIS